MIPVVKENAARQVEDCTFCPKMCRHVCPVSNVSGAEALTPQSKMSRLRDLELGHLPTTAELAEPLYGCTGCRQCTTACEHHNEPGLLLLSGRAKAVQAGAGHPALAGYPTRFSTRERRLRGELLERWPEQQAVTKQLALIPGCDAIDKNPADIDDMLSLFASFGETAWMPSTSCAGYPLLAAGYENEFVAHARMVAAELTSTETLVVNCSACVAVVKQVYPLHQIAIPPRVIPMATFLTEQRSKLALPDSSTKPTVYYHDPCHLARYADCIDAPREVLSRVATVQEFAWSHKNAECCGGGGLLPKTFPDIANGMARERLRDIKNRGGGTVVTSCSTCSFMLKANAPDGVDVYDLPEYLVVAQSSKDDIDELLGGGL